MIIEDINCLDRDFKIYRKDNNFNSLFYLKIRILFIILIFLAGFSVISFRILEISTFKVKKDTLYTADNKSDFGIYKRAEIVDRNGVLLATNIPTKSLYLNMDKAIELEDSIEKLVKALPYLNKDSLINKINSKQKFIWIKRNLTPKEEEKIMMLGLPGFYFKDEERRLYPQNNLFAHTIGYTDIDSIGLAGIERSFNDYLSGKDNKKLNSLMLSLDIRVQEAVKDEISKAIEKYSADGGVGIVMDINNFEVYGMVSLPDFDPHNPGLATSEEKFNKATYGTYEMGSIFKIFNTAIAIESGLISKDNLYDITPPLHIENFNIVDFVNKQGFYSVEEIFMHSSNIGSAKIAMDFGQELQEEFLGKLGMLTPLNTQFLEVSSPSYPDYWDKLSVATISYGYGIAVTPAHVMQATASIINGGYFNDISFIPRKKEDLKKISEKVISKETSDYMRKLMRITLKYGTGSKAAMNKYFTGGKTGTANKLKKEGGYDKESTLTSFIGAFPMNNPVFMILVIIDNPKMPGVRLSGGKVASPVFNEIVKRMGAIYSIPPVDENDYKLAIEFLYKKRDSDI